MPTRLADSFSPFSPDKLREDSIIHVGAGQSLASNCANLGLLLAPFLRAVPWRPNHTPQKIHAGRRTVRHGFFLKKVVISLLFGQSPVEEGYDMPPRADGIGAEHGTRGVGALGDAQSTAPTIAASGWISVQGQCARISTVLDRSAGQRDLPGYSSQVDIGCELPFRPRSVLSRSPNARRSAAEPMDIVADAAATGTDSPRHNAMANTSGNTFFFTCSVFSHFYGLLHRALGEAIPQGPILLLSPLLLFGTSQELIARAFYTVHTDKPRLFVPENCTGGGCILTVAAHCIFLAILLHRSGDCAPRPCLGKFIATGTPPSDLAH